MPLEPAAPTREIESSTLALEFITPHKVLFILRCPSSSNYLYNISYNMYSC